MKLISETKTTLTLNVADGELDRLLASRVIRDNRTGNYYKVELPLSNDGNDGITATFRICDLPVMFDIVNS